MKLRKRSNRKIRSFTLLELMVCFAIIAIIAGVIGLRVKKSLDQAHFANSAKMVKQELEKLELLALTFSSDMHLEIKKEKDQYVMISKTDEAVLKKLNRTKLSLKGVETVSWNNKPNGSRSIDFTLLSNGRIIHSDCLGVLGLHRVNDSFFLDMRTPLQIKMVKCYNECLKETPLPKRPSSLDEDK